MSAAPGEPDQRVYIIDTSSILEARRLLARAPLTDLKRVYKALAGLVEQGVLRYPAEVYEELLRGHEMVGGVARLWKAPPPISFPPFKLQVPPL